MFETRERAAEAKFVHERDVAFQAHAHRDRMFGRWAARLMGLRGPAIENYARSLMFSDVESVDDEALLARVRSDLAERDVAGPRAAEDRLRRKLERLNALARADLGG